MTIRVVLADDHALVRSTLQMVITDTTDVEIVGDAGNTRVVILTLTSSVPAGDPDLAGGPASVASSAVRPAAPAVIGTS